MSVSIPQPFKVKVNSVGPVGPVTVDGIPSSYDISIKEIPALHLSVDHLPTIELDVKPVELSLRLKEIPSVRGHLPADFSVGLSILGIELMAVRLCGEAQMITEPYEPNPCEVCGRPSGSTQGIAKLAG